MLCWMIALPKGAGPDEPTHLARGAALVRGQLLGESDYPHSSYSYIRVPWWVVQPNPACFAFQPLQPANCAVAVVPEEGAEVRILNQATSYPPTAQVLAGLATLLPGQGRTQLLARVSNGLVPGLLIIWSLVLLRRFGDRWLLRVGAVAALTPGVWFFASVVNPSGWTAAGALAMWTALLGGRRRVGDLVDTGGEPVWLFTAGWCAMTLSRFDGLAFAVLVVVLGWLWGAGDLLRELRRRRLALAVVTLAAVANAGWAVYEPRRDFLVGGRATEVAVVVALAVAGLVLARSPRRGDASPRGRDIGRWLWLTPVVFVAAPVVAFFIASSRRGTPPAAAVGITGRSIEEAIGVLGWVDTRIPAVAFAMWFIAAGALVGVAVLHGSRRSVIVMLSAVACIPALQWFLQDRLDYWHGRYLFALTVGVPLIAGGSVRVFPGDARTWRVQRLGAVLGVTIWAVWVLAFAQTMRRFGVGAVGNMNPARWDTYGAPFPPWLLLVVFATASALLLWYILAPKPPETSGGTAAPWR